MGEKTAQQKEKKRKDSSTFHCAVQSETLSSFSLFDNI